MNSNWGRSDPSDPPGGNASSWGYGDLWRQWQKTTQVKKPVDMYVFIDESPATINDAFFIHTWGTADVGGYPSSGSANGKEGWCDTPAHYHNRATGFGFADGHAEIHRWSGAEIKLRKQGGVWINAINEASGADRRWYVQHVAERR
jgi:prepilin-type processing-associated H-X9-DG protein